MKSYTTQNIPLEKRIITIRNEKIILDTDLAETSIALYLLIQTLGRDAVHVVFLKTSASF